MTILGITRAAIRYLRASDDATSRLRSAPRATRSNARRRQQEHHRSRRYVLSLMARAARRSDVESIGHCDTLAHCVLPS